MPSNGTGLSSREDILGSHDRSELELDVPTWGRIRIRELGAVEQKVLGRMWMEEKPTMEIAVQAVALCVIDGEGNRVFSDDDLDLLAQKNHKHITAVFEEITRISSETEEAIKAALGESNGTLSTSSSTPGG